jgi:hypothetical protein
VHLARLFARNLKRSSSLERYRHAEPHPPMGQFLDGIDGAGRIYKARIAIDCPELNPGIAFNNNI